MRKALFLLLLLSSCGRMAHERAIPSRGLIVLDAGHGDHDKGAVGADEKTKEKNLTLHTVRLTRSHLQKLGYRVLLTRTKDAFVPLNDRANIANRAGAALFVSIHYNAAENKKASGIEVFVYNGKQPAYRKQESEQLANEVLESLLTFTKAQNRGVKEKNLAVLRETTMPAILIEAGFVTNAEDLKKLQDSRYLNTLAWAIAHGINQYYR